MELAFDVVLVVPGYHKMDIIRQLLQMGVAKEKIVPWFTEGGHRFKSRSFEIQDDCVLATMDDIRIALRHSSDFVAFEEIYLRNTYDFFYRARPAVAIDIGMNIGLASLWLAHEENIERVYAFEPFPETFQQAKENLARNPALARKIHAENIALSDCEGTRALGYRKDFPGGMSIFGEEDAAGDAQSIVIKKAGDVLCPIFAAEKDHDIFVKIDCEGSEYEILDDLERAGILDVPKVYVMETHLGREQELLERLRRHGYAYFDQYDGRGGLGALYAVKVAQGD